MKRVLTVMLVFFIAVSFAFTEGQAEEEVKGPVTVGAKNFTEQYIMGQMIKDMLEANNFKTKTNFGLASPAVRNGIVTGQIDVYADYTGTGWITYLKKEEPIKDPVKLFNKLKEEDKQNGIVWFGMTEVNNTYALAVTQEFSDEHGITTVSDLVQFVNKNPKEYVFGIDYEFYERPDGFFAMAEHYGLDIPKKQVKTMEIGLTYEAIDQGSIDVAMVFATDGKLKKFDMVVLEDDKNFFPVYSLAFCATEEILAEYPEIKDILSPLADEITSEEMIDMNYMVDAQKKEPQEIAENFLKDMGLVD